MIKSILKIFSFLLLIASFLSRSSAQTTTTPPSIYVSKSNNSLNKDGSIDSPYQSLTDAFDFIQTDASNPKEYIINIAPAADAYLLTKSYKFELKAYKITVKKWINTTLPEGQPDDLPKVNFTNASLQFLNVSRVRFESLNIIGDRGSILLNSTDLQLNNLTFEEEFGSGDEPFINVNNAQFVEIIKLDIKVTFYNTLIRYQVTEESLDPLIVMNEIHYTIDSRVDLQGEQTLFDFQSIHASKMMAFKGSVEIQDFRFDIIYDGRLFTLENILSVDGFGGVYLGNFAMEDNTIKVYFNKSAFSFSKINYVTINKVNIRNNILMEVAMYPFFALEAVKFLGVSNLNFSSNQLYLLGGSTGDVLFELRNIGQLEIINHTLTNNTFQNQPSNLIAMLPYHTTETDLTLTMKNVIFVNNSALGIAATVTYLKVDGPVLQSWLVEDFIISQNSLSGKLLDFLTYSMNSRYTVDSRARPPSERSFKGVKIINNPNIIDFNFLYFAPTSYIADADECVLFSAQDKFTFYDLEIVNNRFSKGNSPLWAYEPSLLQVKQSSVGFINLVMKNNNFDTYNFLSLDHKPSSFILNGSSITDTNFSSCQLVASNYLKGYACATVGSKTVTPPSLLYRFAFIHDSVFSNIELISSDFINLNNGFLSVKGTTFKDLKVQESSTLISNKFYALPLLPHKTAYARDIPFEATIFKGFPELWGAYNETLDRVDPEAAYFCSFYDNRFESIQLANSSLISLEKFQLKPTFIEIAKNNFNEITASHSSILIDLLNFWDLRVTQNTFVELNGKLKAISISPHGGSKALTVYDNTFQSAEILSFLSYAGKSLKELKFSQNQFLNAHYSLSGVTIDVDTATGDWMMENNHFENNTVEFEGNALEASAFLLIKTKSATQSSNNITLQNNIFQLVDVSIGFEGFQGSLVSAISINTFQSVYFRKNSILESFALVSGGLLEINVPKGGFYIEDCEFREVLTYYSKSMITFTAAQFSVNNSKFSQMESQGETGLFSQVATSPNSLVQILNSRFDKIFTNSFGALLTSKSSSILRTSRPEFGISLQMDNCTMVNFENEQVFHLHDLICSSCVIKNSFLQTFQSKEMLNLKSTFFFEKVYGSIEIQNIQFLLPRNAPVTLIQTVNSTSLIVTLRNIHYDGFISQKKRTLLNLATLDSGTFAVQDSLFENIFLDKLPFVNVVPNLNSPHLKENLPLISFYNASFSKISSPKGTEGITPDVCYSNAFAYDYSIGAKFLIKSLIFSVLPAIFKIQNSTFSEISHLSVLVLGHFESLDAPRYNSTVEITTSVFRNNSAVFGPALTVLPKSYTPTIIIFACVFESNVAEVTGTLTIYNSKLILRNSFFNHNLATIGPAIFMGTKTGQIYSLQNNTFESNLAFYPQDIRFEAVDFKIDFIPAKSSRITPSSALEGNASLVLMNVSDYEMQQGMFRLTFVDSYGNPTPDFSIYRQASFDLPMNAKTKSQVSFNAYMEDCHDDHCDLTLHNLLMAGFVEQNISLNLKFISETIDQYKSIQLNFRPCVAGEHKNGDTCIPCIAPTYSVDPTQACSECPPNADCPGQSQVCPTTGYWNPSPLSKIVRQCRDDDIARCNHENGCGSCAKGYTGPFCETCDFKNNYIETGYLKCGLCENPSKSLMISIIFSTFYSIYQIVSIYIVYSGNKKLLDDDIDHILEKQKVARSFYMKVFLTYTQLMSVLYMGTSSVLKSLGVSSQIGNPAALVTYGTQCSMQALNIDYRNYLYYQTYVIIASPFTQLFIVLFGFLIVKCFTKSIRMREIGVVAFLYLIISFQPGIVANLAQFLTCRTVEGVERPFVASHAYWTCDHPEYLSISKYVALPSLLLWCFFVPLIIFAILFFKRRKLQTQEMTTLVGFFMKDVKVQHYYWGVFLMLMKLSLSFFIYSGNKDAEIQICISLLIIWGYQALLRAKKPYKEDSFNQLEILLMNLLMFNVIAVKYLVNPSNGEKLMSQISIAVVLTLNGGFISYMGYKILPLTFLAIKNLLFKPAKAEIKQPLIEEKNDTLQL